MAPATEGEANWPLVFAHIPKTAGQSLLTALRSELKGASLQLDYGGHSWATTPLVREIVYDGESPLVGTARIGRARLRHKGGGTGSRPLAAYRNGRKLLLRALRGPEPRLIFGHFPIRAYLFAGEPARFATFLRNPVDRVVSQFSYARDRGYFDGTLDEYIEHPELHNRQSERLEGIDIEALDFIGLTDQYAESLAMLRQITGLRLAFHHTNTSRRDQVSASAAVLEEIARRNQADADLYARAKEIFQRRLIACYRRPASASASPGPGPTAPR